MKIRKIFYFTLMVSSHFAFAGGISINKGKATRLEASASIPIDINACRANFHDATWSEEAHCHYSLKETIPDMVKSDLEKEGKTLSYFRIISLGLGGRDLYELNATFSFTETSEKLMTKKWTNLKAKNISQVRIVLDEDEVKLIFVTRTAIWGPAPEWAKKPTSEDLAGSIIKFDYEYSTN